MRSRESYRSRSHDRHPNTVLRLQSPCIHIDRVARLRAMLLGEEAFERANRDRLVDLAAAAGCLAGMRADAPADAGQWVRASSRTIGFLEIAFSDKFDIFSRIGVCGAGHHAGEVGI